MFHLILLLLVFFFFNDTATTEIYTLSLHDALPIFIYIYVSGSQGARPATEMPGCKEGTDPADSTNSLYRLSSRSEEHTSELQSRENLVCRLLLEKKKKKKQKNTINYKREA